MTVVRLFEAAAPYEDTELKGDFDLPCVPAIGDEIDIEVSSGEVRHYTVAKRSFELTVGQDDTQVRLEVVRRDLIGDPLAMIA